MNIIRNFGLLLGAGVLAGCAHVDPNPAFRELANTVHLRTGKRVQWNRGTAEDAQAQAAVSSLLSRPLTAESAVQITLLNNHTLQATQAQAKIELAKAQSEAVQSLEKLNKLMGAFGAQTNWTVASRLPELPGGEVSTSQLESRAIQQRLDLAAARQQFIAEARARGIARAEAILEQAEFGAHYEREIEGTYSIGPSVNVPIPIFNQGQPASARASAKMRQAGQRYLALAADIRSDVRAARDKMLLSRREVEYFKSTALPTRTRVTEESQLEYNAMQVGPVQLPE